MRKVSLVFCLCLFAAQASPPPTRAVPPQARGSEVIGVGDAATRPTIATLYGASRALIIGISKYEHWSQLPGVKEDVAEVSRALRQHGFEVEVQEDLGSERLLPVIKEFLNRPGVGPQDRLLVYYAGHGYRHVPEGGEGGKGFIVPRDAPMPGKEMGPFFVKAVNMDELIAPVGTVRAKHVLFVLDSCYAGTIVDGAVKTSAETRVERDALARFVPAAWHLPATAQDREETPFVPPVILSKVSEAARQFIASGTYKQSVPDDSEFRRRFVQGLTDESGGGADANGDGYVTLTELGEYLQQNVTNQSAGSQRPVWGIIGSKAASQGDFVFVMPGATALEARLGPVIDPASWDLPAGWSYDTGSVRADAPGLMLPRKLVRHSFRDFRFATRLKLSNHTAAGLVLRAQGHGDYYLLRLTGDKFSNNVKENFKLTMHVVRGGREVAQLSEDPLPVDERRLVTRLKNKREIQIVVVAEGDTFTVSLLSDEGHAGALLLMAPIKFVDAGRNFRYGAPGYLTADGERLQIFTSHARKLEPSEKGRP